jgi:xanthine/uracil permease
MDINLLPIALILAAFSLTFTGVMMAGSSLWPQQAEQFKKQIPNIITGVVIVVIASGLIDAFAGGL